VALIYWGQVSAASDITMAAVVNQQGTSTRAAISNLISSVAAGIISGNPTVVAAAAAAVSDALAAYGIGWTTDAPQYLFAFADQSGNLTDLRVRATDGRFPDDVVADLGNRIGVGQSTTTQVARGLSAFPIFAASAAKTKATSAPCAVVWAGSSSIADQGASQANGFVSQVTAALQARWPAAAGTESTVQKSGSATFTLNTAPGIHGYNAGEGGTFASDFLTNAECDRIAALNPRMIAIMVGSNDYKNQVSTSTYMANIAGRLGYFDSILTAPCQFVLIQAYQRADISSPAIPWSAYGDVLRSIASGRPDTVAIDISPSFAAVGIPGADPLGMFTSDNIHVKNEGYRFIADLLIDQILG
jgi:lysophospholipase L1-like esterase